jgi:hypothetical protein
VLLSMTTVSGSAKASRGFRSGTHATHAAVRDGGRATSLPKLSQAQTPRKLL